MMNRVVAFLRLIRWPNLLFIALTQVLFHYCLLLPVFRHARFQPALNNGLLLNTAAASVLIAAAGYVINDYFDINIDHINKPGRQVVGKQVTRRWAILWHSLLSLIGVALGFYVGWKAGVWWIGPSNLMCALLLFVYSTTFKKRMLSGNVIIALLTAWTIALPGLASFYNLYYEGAVTMALRARVLRFTLLYASFAFIISLIREAVKDMEDIKGDAQNGCKTLPIVAGITAAKTYVMVWLVVLIGALVLVQFYAAQLGWWLTVVYALLFIIIPLLYLIRVFFRAKAVKEYSRSSAVAKLVMLTGILSLLFFKLYM
jgi:4-hydroxybenzoate polyprenyltransferase